LSSARAISSSFLASSVAPVTARHQPSQKWTPSVFGSSSSAFLYAAIASAKSPFPRCPAATWRYSSRVLHEASRRRIASLHFASKAFQSRIASSARSALRALRVQVAEVAAEDLSIRGLGDLEEVVHEPPRRRVVQVGPQIRVILREVV
jgi:hypothetical protein